ncbi:MULTISPECIES: LPS translocon maturation chaperone LptM [Phyllobacteriaceae]|uniref:LPS translocon maturation chaperone LptM n=1 Tax=Phyllobacteriaceae TaxID=69277 RepID=UPI002ACA5FE6|nr:lipoprotein [Chelativorans sp. M5D2P16]MDZ5699922.1 lipoprotein [Chelativorans sp. M5D2P16]
MTARGTLILLMLGLALGLTACGRKAPLDTPYEAAVEAREQAERDGEPLPPEPKKPVEDRPFILDGLI